MVRSLSVLTLLKTTPKSVLVTVLGVLAALSAAGSVSAYTGPTVAGQLAEPKNQETSGLAVSHRAPGLLWTHNDSGGDPFLFAINLEGTLRGKVRVDGVANFDWEEMTSFVRDGQAWLLAADIGDNFALRPGCVIHVLPEPDAADLTPDGESLVRPAYSIHFIYEDGPRDAEALAVDVKEGMIYIVSKREPVPRLYRLPLAAASAAQPAVARFLGPVPHLPQPSAIQRAVRTPTQRFIGWPTAMDFSHDGTQALVLVYEQPLLFARAPGESWADALGREPLKLPPHQLPQAEAVCFSMDDRTIFVGSEKTTQFVRYDQP
jgi:hypothetical protein